jgi:hypothetical protein
MEEPPCPCGDTGILDWDDDDVTPCPWCEYGRRAGPLIAADRRKEAGKLDRAEAIIPRRPAAIPA